MGDGVEEYRVDGEMICGQLSKLNVDNMQRGECNDMQGKQAPGKLATTPAARLLDLRIAQGPVNRGMKQLVQCVRGQFEAETDKPCNEVSTTYTDLEY